MKRGTFVVLGILVALLLIWFVVSDEPRQFERAPLTIEKVENLDRLEITPPAGGSGSEQGDDSGGESDSAQGGEAPELIALEKRDGEWWLSQPLEAPVAEDVASTIDEQLVQTIETDALDIQGDDPREYRLDEASAVALPLFGDGSDSPVHRLIVGEQFEVDGTGAVRTFIRQPDDERIYRAQAEIGELVRNSVDEFRSNQVVDLERDALTRLEWNRADGPAIVLEQADEGDGWTLSRPQVDWKLDTGAVDSIVGALSDLTAEEFADDKSAAEIGLESPAGRLTAETKDGSTELLIGRVDGDEEPTYYAKLADEPFQYQIGKYAGDKLVATLTDLRSKTPRTFDREALTEVRFPGEDRVVVRKEDGEWTLVRPEADDSLNSSKLDARLSTVASLTVESFPEVSEAEAGLGAAAERLAFETEDDDFMILLGAEREEGGRYVKFGDDDEIYGIAPAVADKLFPAVDDLVGEAPAGGGKGMPKGLGAKLKGGGPGKGGGGLNKMQKMKMMQQLKRKMGK